PPLRHEWHTGRRRSPSDAVRSCEQPFAARLSRNGCRRAVSIAFSTGRRLGAITARATVHPTDLHTTHLIDRDIEKVEQVAADVGAASGPDVAALRRHIWRHVGGGPCRSSIESV